MYLLKTFYFFKKEGL